jgi:hypothetical protein
MKWAILAMQAPNVVLKFVEACNAKDKAAREAGIAGAIVAAYVMIEPLLAGKPGRLRVMAIVSEFLPQIAARFGA